MLKKGDRIRVKSDWLRGNSAYDGEVVEVRIEAKEAVIRAGRSHIPVSLERIVLLEPYPTGGADA